MRGRAGRNQSHRRRPARDSRIKKRARREHTLHLFLVPVSVRRPSARTWDRGHTSSPAATLRVDAAQHGAYTYNGRVCTIDQLRSSTCGVRYTTTERSPPGRSGVSRSRPPPPPGAPPILPSIQRRVPPGLAAGATTRRKQEPQFFMISSNKTGNGGRREYKNSLDVVFSVRGSVRRDRQTEGGGVLPLVASCTCRLFI